MRVSTMAAGLAAAAAALAGCATAPDDLAIETGGAPVAALAEAGLRQQLPPEDTDDGDDDDTLAVSGVAQLLGSARSPATIALAGQGGPVAAATTPLSAGSPLATPSASRAAGASAARGPAASRGATDLLNPGRALGGGGLGLGPVAATSRGGPPGLIGGLNGVAAASNTQLANAVAAVASRTAMPLTGPPGTPAAAVLSRVLPTLVNPPVGP